MPGRGTLKKNYCKNAMVRAALHFEALPGVTLNRLSRRLRDILAFRFVVASLEIRSPFQRKADRRKQAIFHPARAEDYVAVIVPWGIVAHFDVAPVRKNQIDGPDKQHSVALARNCGLCIEHGAGPLSPFRNHEDSTGPYIALHDDLYTLAIARICLGDWLLETEENLSAPLNRDCLHCTAGRFVRCLPTQRKRPLHRQ